MCSSSIVCISSFQVEFIQLLHTPPLNNVYSCCASLSHFQASFPLPIGHRICSNKESIGPSRKNSVYVKVELKYLGTIVCKHGSIEGEIWERTVKGRQVMGALERVMKGRNVSVEVKRAIRNSVILSTLSNASETWTWNAAQQSRIRAVEMSLWCVKVG